MKTITIVINGENVVSISPDRVAGAAGAYGISKIKFVLDEEWDNLDLKCNFENAKGETPTEVMLDGSFECEIPSEALKYEGTTWFSLYGTDSDSRMINIRDWLTVGKSVSPGNSPTPPTPDLISQHNTNSEAHNNKFGIFSDLYTTAKNTVVAAINELFDKFSDYFTKTETTQLVDDEANTRINVDTALQENINSEAEARSDADDLKVDKNFTGYTTESSLADTDITLINKEDGTHKKSTLALLSTWILSTFATTINSKSQSIVSAVSNLYNFFNQKQFNGFEKEKDLYTCTYNEVNRTVTLSYAGGIYYWFNGERHSLGTSWTSSAHPNDTSTKYYLKCTDGTNFVWSATAWSFDDIQVYISPSHRLYGFEEHHGTQDKFSHEGEHKGLGAMRDSGGDVTGYTLNSTTASQRRPTIAELVLKDEDRKSTLPQQNGNYAFAYLSGATGTVNYAVDQADILRLSTNQPYYNLFTGGAWTEALLPNSPNVSSTSGYMCLWLLALPVDGSTRSRKYRFLWLQGQSQGSLASQQALTTLNVNLGDLANESPEIIFLEKVIVRYTSGNWVIVEQTKITGSRVNQVSVQGATFNGVTTDSTLTGNGTVNNPLSVPTLENKLDKVFTLIETDFDLNNYVTAGIYNFANGTVSNLPSDAIFNSAYIGGHFLKVFASIAGDIVHQELNTIAYTNQTKVACAMRDGYFYEGVWTFSAWTVFPYYDLTNGYTNLPVNVANGLMRLNANGLNNPANITTLVAKLTRTSDGVFDFSNLNILNEGGIYDIHIYGAVTSGGVAMFINKQDGTLDTATTGAYMYNTSTVAFADGALIVTANAYGDFVNYHVRLCLQKAGALANAHVLGTGKGTSSTTNSNKVGAWVKTSAVDNINLIHFATASNGNITTTGLTIAIYKRGA